MQLAGRKLLTGITALFACLVLTDGPGADHVMPLGPTAVSYGAATLMSTVRPAAPHTLSASLLVTSGTLPARHGRRTSGSVACPTNGSGQALYPRSGGVHVDSSSVVVSVRSTFPHGTAWEAVVNNAGTTDTTFSVWAVCAAPGQGYAVYGTAAVTVPPGISVADTQYCPHGTRVLGGGVSVSERGLSVHLRASYPVRNGWRNVVGNQGQSNATLGSYAVCATFPNRTGYVVTVGSSVDNPPSSQTSTTLACPSGLSPLGGGMSSNTGDTSVDISSTYPLTGAWTVTENNGSAADHSLTPYVICAS